MNERIRLVQGDTRPQVVISMQTSSGAPISCVGATVVMRFRAEGTNSTLAAIAGTLLTGYANADGSINTSAPYNVAGAGGRVAFNWPAGVLDVPEGDYEGEVEVTFSDLSVQTIYDVIKFRIREDFA